MTDYEIKDTNSEKRTPIEQLQIDIYKSMIKAFMTNMDENFDCLKSYLFLMKKICEPKETSHRYALQLACENDLFSYKTDATIWGKCIDWHQKILNCTEKSPLTLYDAYEFSDFFKEKYTACLKRLKISLSKYLEKIEQIIPRD